MKHNQTIEDDLVKFFLGDREFHNRIMRRLANDAEFLTAVNWKVSHIINEWEKSKEND